MPELLTLRDISTIANLSQRTVARLVAARAFGEPIRIGRNVRFPRQDILAWIERRCRPMA
jgi:excisionase family DNA binding protein